MKTIPRWNPNVIEFEVSVYYNNTCGDIIRLLKPISVILGNRNTATFIIRSKKVVIISK